MTPDQFIASLKEPIPFERIEIGRYYMFIPLGVRCLLLGVHPFDGNCFIVEIYVTDDDSVIDTCERMHLAEIAQEVESE